MPLLVLSLVGACASPARAAVGASVRVAPIGSTSVVPAMGPAVVPPRGGAALAPTGRLMRPTVPYLPSDSADAPRSRWASVEDLEAASRAAWAEGHVAVARRLMAIAQAYREVGRPYRFGGDGRSTLGIDCSALIQYAYRRAGLVLPRTSREQARVGLPLPMALGELTDGDLLFFAKPGESVSHVALYIGGSQFVHASSRSHQVTVSSLYEPLYARMWVAARRVAL